MFNQIKELAKDFGYTIVKGDRTAIYFSDKIITVNFQQIERLSGERNVNFVYVALLHELGHAQQELCKLTPSSKTSLKAYEIDAWRHAEIFCQLIFGEITEEFKRLRYITVGI